MAQLSKGTLALRQLGTYDIAAKTGFSARSVRLWKERRTPSEAAREALQKHFAIEPGSFFVVAYEEPKVGPRLPPEELERTRIAVATISKILTREDVTDDAKALLFALGNDLARALNDSECPSFAARARAAE